MKLSHTEESFIAEYIANGFNGTQAYLKVKPKVKEAVAAASATRFLKKVSVQNAIEDHLKERKEDSIASK